MAQGLRLAEACMGYLVSPEADGLDVAGCGETLVALSRVQARLAAARAGLLRRFDVVNGHDGDGYGSCGAMLESLGDKRGADDDRSAGKQFYDALQEACCALRVS